MLFRPSPSHTHRTQVAHTESGFIDEVDALPLHDTATDPNNDGKSAPTHPRQEADNTFTDEAVVLGELESPAPHGVTVPVPVSRCRGERSALERYRHVAQWIPWSIAVGIAGVGAFRFAAVLAGTLDTMIGTMALGASIACAVLLVAAQYIQANRR